MRSIRAALFLIGYLSGLLMGYSSNFAVDVAILFVSLILAGVMMHAELKEAE